MAQYHQWSVTSTKHQVHSSRRIHHVQWANYQQQYFTSPMAQQPQPRPGMKILHNVHEPAHSVNIVPALVENSLLSTNKFAEAEYTVIYDKDKVNFYNTRTKKITVLEEAILTGWQCPHQKMWCIPLVPIVTNLNTDTLLLDHPSRLDSLNAMYAASSSKVAHNHVVLHLGKLAQRDHIHNVY
jgi:hypothetical protein